LELQIVRCEVLAVQNITIMAFWVVIPCSLGYGV